MRRVLLWAALALACISGPAAAQLAVPTANQPAAGTVIDIPSHIPAGAVYLLSPTGVPMGNTTTPLVFNCNSGCSGGGTSNFAAAFPSAGMAIGVKNGANMVNLTADGSNNLNVDLATALPAGSAIIGKTDILGNAGGTLDTAAGSPASTGLTIQGFGSAGTASGGVMSVQGVASMTPLLANPGTAANWGVGATGSAVPANSVYLGASSGGNLTGLVACNSHFHAAQITSGTDTLLVQGVSSQTVKICGAKVNFSGSAAQSGYLENTASTNANCSSSNTQIGNLITGNSTTPGADGFYGPFWSGLANTVSNGVCFHTTGTGGADVEIWYTQGS